MDAALVIIVLFTLDFAVLSNICMFLSMIAMDTFAKVKTYTQYIFITFLFISLYIYSLFDLGIYLCVLQLLGTNNVIVNKAKIRPKARKCHTVDPEEGKTSQES